MGIVEFQQVVIRKIEKKFAHPVSLEFCKGNKATDYLGLRHGIEQAIGDEIALYPLIAVGI